MKLCSALRFDSLRSVRRDIDFLFSPFKNNDSLHESLFRYVLQTQLRSGKTPQQRASLIRGTISLILDEARRRRCFSVALATLHLVVEHRDQLQLGVNDPAWARNAIAACTNAEERKTIEHALQQRFVGEVAENDRGKELQLSSQQNSQVLFSPLARRGEGSRDIVSNKRSLGEYSASAVESMQQHRLHTVTAPNASFSRYFLNQRLVQDELEVMELFRAMVGRRPATFRVHMSQMYGKATSEVLKGRQGVEPLRWLPEGCEAFIFHDSPEVPHSVTLANRELLNSLFNEGLISFQSTSSMLPVLLLHPLSGEALLDMCASPGNKTSLALDYMYSQTCSSSFKRAVRHGCVIANDATPSRGWQLAQRLRDTYPGIAVTRLKGQCIPCRSISAGGVRYDKILVDAPCSAEGRMQRDVMSWRLWHPLKGMEFMQTQLQLLRRAVELCAARGQIIYSTCTLNPLENEAVIASLLLEGKVELVEPPPHIRNNSNWRFSRGLRRWVVPTSSGGFVHSAADAASIGMTTPIPLRNLFSFEGCESVQSALEGCCLRVMPHHNGGAEGFFLALLRKKTHSLSLPSVPLPSRGMDNSGVVENNGVLGRKLPGGEHWRKFCPHARRIEKLDSGNPLLRKHLGVFFDSNPAKLDEFMRNNNLCAVWGEKCGLALVSSDTWSHVNAIFPETPSDDELLALGITIIDGRTGNLTVGGAYSLGTHVTSRVLQLPLPELQWLLSNQVLTVNELYEDQRTRARRTMIGVDIKEKGIDGALQQVPRAWVANLVSAIGEEEGNFIVRCIPASVEGVYERQSAGVSGSARGLHSISIPVTVKRLPVVQLHSLLPQNERRLSMAVIGRVVAHAKKYQSIGTGKECMQLGAAYNAAATVGSATLHGRLVTHERKQRCLFSSDDNLHNHFRRAPPANGDKKESEKQEGRFNSTKHFVI
uniref:SAM-dependent MTase RsmB/NOP-type domain-containing protein n=1 Tax=Trypanosoma congolense (strain IL3000) TaxID=1068625 RepID=G0UMW2_TRYCI|nr:conserved hypothetical protein [Trypanosoma congolense IL3000]